MTEVGGALEKLAAIGRGLYARHDAGVVVPFVEKEGDGWAPAQGMCHANAKRWVAENPGCKAVPGWMVFDLRFWGRFRFSAHSVIEEADGTRIDITPSPASRRYPFLQHDGEHEEFLKLIGSLMVQDLDYELATGAVIVRPLSLTPSAAP